MKTKAILISSILVIILSSAFYVYWNKETYEEIQLRVEKDPRVSNGTSGDFWFPCKPENAARYTAYRSGEKINIDGKLDEEVWQNAARSGRFVDLITGLPTRYDTRVAVVWDDENLYVGFWVEEPNVTANFTEYGSPVAQDNDVEIFIAGRDAYYDFEINAFNTVYEAFFVFKAAYERSGFVRIPHLSIYNPRVNSLIEANPEHPRGPRLGSWDIRMENLQSAVFVNGTINDDQDVDQGWTVELAFPWASLALLTKGDDRSVPPNNNDVWRIDFSRFNKEKAPSPPEDSSGWFMSPHGTWDSHLPECFPYITFSTKEVEKTEQAEQVKA